MEERFDINIVNADVISSIKNIKKIVTPIGYLNAYELDVYEWTWVDYKQGDSNFTDKMGYGIDHKMTVATKVSGDKVMLSNTYDDSFVFKSEATVAAPVMNAIEEESSTGFLLDANSIDSNYLDVNAIIRNADKYVIHQYSTNPATSYTQYYDSAYYSSSGTDCANFVSQCLRAGGLSDVSGSNGWWYDRTKGNTLLTASSPSWRNVPNLITYFKGNGVAYDPISTNHTNVYPGNPVITSDEGHVAICVGYNSSGTPIINGHTRDVYHMPLSGYAKTLKIFTANKMVTKPGGSLTTEISTTSSAQTKTVSVDIIKNKYFKVVPTVTGTYKFNGTLTGSYAMYAYLYQESKNSNGVTLGLYEIDYDLGLSRFNLSARLNAGQTYYIRCFVNAPYNAPSTTETLTLVHGINVN